MRQEFVHTGTSIINCNTKANRKGFTDILELERPKKWMHVKNQNHALLIDFLDTRMTLDEAPLGIKN